MTHNLVLGNYDFDPKSDSNGPKDNGQIQVEVELYAAAGATETSPVATGTYEPIADRKQPAMKVGGVTVTKRTVEGNSVKNDAWAIATFGMRQDSIKINSVKGDQVEGEFVDYGAPEFSGLKGAFNATVAK